MDATTAIQMIDRALGKLAALRGSRVNSPLHVEFVQSTGLDLARIFGPQSTVSRNFGSLNFHRISNFFASAFDLDQELEQRRHQAYLRGLDMAEGVLLSARNQLSEFGADRVLHESRVRSDGARVFVSHGTKTEALRKVEAFLRSLGTDPIIVVSGASEGMSVDDLVATRLGESDCAVILATADEAIDGRKQPRPNVLHEIGLAQEMLDNRVIYLKEDGCTFPSNIGPKVWENFTQANMEAAFEKIAKEFRAFGLL